MTKKVIGSSFYDELIAHGGLVGQHFTWKSDGMIEFFDDTPQQVIDGVNAVYEAHDPKRQSTAEVSAQIDTLLASADAATAGMADAFVAGLLSDPEIAKFKSWAAYKMALKKVDEQAGYPTVITWPNIPA